MTGDPRIVLAVPEHAAGTRLDRFLATPLGSRARAQSLIDAGRVRVDGAQRPKRHLVAAGEAIEIEEGAVESGLAPDDEASFEVAYEDDYLLVVDKPAGVVVHPARGHLAGTLSQALAGRAAGGDEPWRAGIVHRLDRDTSGLLVVAKNDAVHRSLKSLLSDRHLRREYLALVDGHPPARSGTIDAPIGRHRRERKLMSIDSDDPREARTHFEIERLLPTAALLRVALETGRTHQIRVHLAAIGHPVSGDPQYGTRGRFGLDRQFLHAARLAFPHPVTGEEIDVRSELPADLVAALARAEPEHTGGVGPDGS
ncbi:MAG TPA: RluA family pseudouridine synthase [Solirubrobacteraceae bacterium]